MAGERMPVQKIGAVLRQGLACRLGQRDGFLRQLMALLVVLKVRRIPSSASVSWADSARSVLRDASAPWMLRCR